MQKYSVDNTTKNGEIRKKLKWFAEGNILKINLILALKLSTSHFSDLEVI